MNGYLIFHNDRVLGERKWWRDDEYAYIWTEDEKNSILKESESWQFKPTHIQKVVLLAGKINRYEKIEINK